MIMLIEVSRIVKSQRHKVEQFTKGCGEQGIGNYYLADIRVSILEHKKVLKIDNADGCTTLGMYLMPPNCTFKTGLKW